MPLDNQAESFYLVNDHDQVLGKISRKKAHSNKKNIHRAIGVFLTNEKKQLLMQKRSRKKDMEAGEWSYSVGGHVTYGQTYYQAAIREIYEELGISVKPKFITKAMIKMKKEIEFTGLYKLKISSKTEFKLDEDEVQAVQWVYLDQLVEFIKTHSVSDWTITSLKVAHYI